MNEVNIQKTLRLHVERGIGYLVNDVKGYGDLIKKVS